MMINRKHIKYLTLWLISQLSIFATYAQQQPEPKLQITPNKCVALRQGQTCYTDLAIQWHSQEPRDLCVYQTGNSEALKCWQNRTQGSFSGEIKTDKTIEFQLREEKTNLILASSMLKIAWVYKRKRRAVSWRIF
jgi:hypothetical protein